MLGLLLLGLFFLLLFFFLRLVFVVLFYLSPVMLVLLLVLNAGLLLDYLRALGARIRENPGAGLLQTGLSLLFLPFVLAYLLSQALINKQLKASRKPEPEREWTAFEELESHIPRKKTDSQDFV